MALTIETLEAQRADAEKMTPLVADRRLFLDMTKEKLCENGSVEAAYQLAAPGHRIPNAETRRLGLRMHEGRVIQGEPPAEEKQREKPADKSRTPEGDKSGAPETKGAKATK